MSSLIYGLIIAVFWGCADVQCSLIPGNSLRVALIAQSVGLVALAYIGIEAFGYRFFLTLFSLCGPTLLLLSGLGLLSALAYFCMYRALQSAATTGVMSAILSANGAVSVLASIIFLHEYDSHLLLLLGLILGGVLLTAISQTDVSRQTSGIFCAVVAMVALGGFNFGIGFLASTGTIDWFPLLFGTRAFSLFFLTLAFALHPRDNARGEGQYCFRSFLLASGTGLAEVIGLLLFSFAAHLHIDLAIISAIASCSSILPLLSSFIRRESVHRDALGGIVLILLGLIGLSWTAISPLLVCFIAAGVLYLLLLQKNDQVISTIALIRNKGVDTALAATSSWNKNRARSLVRGLGWQDGVFSPLLRTMTYTMRKERGALILLSRIGTLAHNAHHYGFALASSLEKVSQPLMVHEREQMAVSQRELELNGVHMINTSSHAQAAVVEGEQKDLDVRAGYEQPTISTPEPATPLQASPPPGPAHSPRKQSIPRYRALVATLVALLVVAGAVLLPALFSAQPALMGTTPPGTPGVPSVGQVAFTSSGQFDPASSIGLNDTITVSLHNLSTPVGGQSYYAWLMPDATDDNTIPLLLGRLSIAHGTTQLTYSHPAHENLLAVYSGFEVAEQPSNQIPTTPPLDPKEWRYVGSIPNTPTPGDELHFSLLSHMRHLLAKDPTLQHIGLQGGLDIWLYRNSEKILEWSSAARDSWAGGQQTDLVHRHMLRVLDYLDGTAYVYNSGDVPSGSPLLVDPQMGRIGLLEVSPTQVLPAYLTHVDTHLQGLINAPGHSQTQRQLAIKIDNALTTDTSLFQEIRQDAIKLVNMSDTQLQSNDALSLLNDMVTKANAAYTGQFDPTIGGNINGIAWIHNELQGFATMSVTTTSANKQ